MFIDLPTTHCRNLGDVTATPKRQKYTAMTSKSAAAMALSKDDREALVLPAVVGTMSLDVAMKLMLPPIKDASKHDRATCAAARVGKMWNRVDKAKDTRHPTRDARLANVNGRAI